MRQTVCQIVHEMIRATGVALTNEPARNELRVGIERNPRPNIARAFLLHFKSAAGATKIA
jgi:hypothetical protein